MTTLTLSYFICEMTLMDCDYIQEKPSKLAAASFLLALYMRDKKNGVKGWGDGLLAKSMRF